MQDNTIRILVVDDNTLNLQLTGRLLSDAGFVSLVATSAMQAYAIAKTKQPALILTDIMMPDVDGREFCRIIRQDELTKNIPVIFVSATADPQVMSSAIEAGGNNFLSKPFSGDELLRMIRTELNLEVPEDKDTDTIAARPEEVSGSEYKDTTLLDSLTVHDQVFRTSVISDFRIICKRVEIRLEGIVKKQFARDVVYNDLHRLANLCPYIANKSVIQVIRAFESDLRAGKEVSNEQFLSFITLLCALKSELEKND